MDHTWKRRDTDQDICKQCYRFAQVENRNFYYRHNLELRIWCSLEPMDKQIIEVDKLMPGNNNHDMKIQKIDTNGNT